jgi:hypothetical protein
MMPRADRLWPGLADLDQPHRPVDAMNIMSGDTFKKLT